MTRWDDNLWLLTPEEFDQIPEGTYLVCINGGQYIKGKDFIDMDTRCGYLAFGVRDPLNHIHAELFTKFMLSQ